MQLSTAIGTLALLLAAALAAGHALGQDAIPPASAPTTMQKKANLHFSLSLDLFGNEISTNAANAFHAGLKGRFREDRLEDDHKLESATYPVIRLVDGKMVITNPLFETSPQRKA